MALGWYLNSAVGLHGAVIFWTGLWSLLDHIPGAVETRDVGFVLTGLLLFALFEVYFGSLTAKGNQNDSFHSVFERQVRWKGRLYSYTVSLHVLFASVLTWVGLYNLADRHLVRDTSLSQLVFLLLGLALLTLTNSLFYVAGINEPHQHAAPAITATGINGSVSPPQPGSASDPDSGAALLGERTSTSVSGLQHRSHGRGDEGETEDGAVDCLSKVTHGFYLRRLIGLVGEVLIWVATSKFLDRHGFHRTVLREATYYLLGFAGITVSSDLYCTGTWLREEPLKSDRSPASATVTTASTSQARFLCMTYPPLVHGRAVVATLSFMLFWTAIDNLLEQDNYLFHRTFWRESFYVVSGLAVLIATDTLGGQSTPFSWSRPTVQTLHPYDAIDSDEL